MDEAMEEEQQEQQEPQEESVLRINGAARKGDGLRPQDSPLPRIISGKLKPVDGYVETLDFLRKMIQEPACMNVAKGTYFGKYSQCTCLHSLAPSGPDDETAELRLHMIASHVVHFGCLKAEMRTMLAVEWYRYAQIYHKQGKPAEEHYHLAVMHSGAYKSHTSGCCDLIAPGLR